MPPYSHRLSRTFSSPDRGTPAALVNSQEMMFDAEVAGVYAAVLGRIIVVLFRKEVSCIFYVIVRSYDEA